MVVDSVDDCDCRVVDVVEVVVVVDVVVVDCFLVVVVDVVDEVVVVGGRVVVVVDAEDPPGTEDVVVDSPGMVVDVVVVVEAVVDVGAVVVVASWRSRSSGEAVKIRSTLTPWWAAFITSAKICAGNEPPVTARPCTFVIGCGGVFGSLSSKPIHTPVASCGV